MKKKLHLDDARDCPEGFMYQTLMRHKPSNVKVYESPMVIG